MSSSGSEGNIAVIHLCFPLLGRHKEGQLEHCLLEHPLLTEKKWLSDECCYALSVWLEQDLVFELLALTQLQVEDEAWDALQLLAEILHFEFSYLGVYEHHELPCAAKEMSFIIKVNQPVQFSTRSSNTKKFLLKVHVIAFHRKSSILEWPVTLWCPLIKLNATLLDQSVTFDTVDHSILIERHRQWSIL